MAVNVRLSQTRSGGASEGRGYLKELIEIDMDGVYFTGEYFAMASAGVVWHVPMLCGYSASETLQIIKSIGGDKFQKMNPKKGILNYIKWALGVRFKFFPDCEKAAKEYFSWEKLKACNRLSSNTKPMIAICKAKDILNYIKKDVMQDIMKGRFESPLEIMFDGAPESLAHEAPIYFFSYDGVYTWNYEYKKLRKVSDKVTPLWQCYLMAFANIGAFGKIYSLDFGGIFKERPLDGGAVCNFANLLGVPHQLISCVAIPTKSGLEAKKGIASLSWFNYFQNPAEKASKAIPFEGSHLAGFYDVSDELIDKEYKFAVDNWDKNRYFS
jgi:hypothetical protein